MNDTPSKANQTSRKASPWRWVWLGVFVILAGATAIGVYNFVRDFVASWEITDLPGFVVNPVEPTPGTQEPGVTPTARPPQVEAAPTPEPWDGASRVSVLVMGLDYRDWSSGEGAPRTDTMILFTVDPLSKTAAMLSIPRDLWVNIPGFEPGRINTAYRLGETYNVIGGGPQLAMDTVEELLGIPIDYYAQIDFSAFVRFVDEIGGVKVEVMEEIKVDLIGDGANTIKVLQPGRQTLPGDIALAYARARYTEGGDFDRATRQQQVVFAVRDRILEFEMIPTLLAKAPVLYNEVAAGINTNMNLDQAVKLGLLVLLEVPRENIKQGIIGTEHIAFGASAEGDQVLKPLPAKIRLLRDELFTTEGLVSPLAESGDLNSLLKAEAATISVLNGSGVSGLAAETAEYLRSQGLDAPESALGDGDATFYTIVIDRTGNPYTVKYLLDLFSVLPNNYRISYEPGSGADIEIVLGNDWANSNPMP